ncbi:transcription factor bHLH70 isoform X2 [Cornus florida]|uniref:transcription factor bHLH70 isoform X2 n=1 Tax=Cornus florida TaxID=4283 RepID=UPI002898EAD8|nr:transcription factor bHLH70 isoform X2 [Cornus florida]
MLMDKFKGGSHFIHQRDEFELFGEEILDVESTEQDRDSTWGLSGYGHFVDAESMLLQQPSQYLTWLEDDKIPFLQMLQSADSPPFEPAFSEPSFQLLLRLQHQKIPWNHNHYNHLSEMGDQITTKYRTIQALEHESCVTHDVSDLHSPAKSEADGHRHYPHSASCVDGASSDLNQDQPTSADKFSGEGDSVVRPRSSRFSVSPPENRERRKRKRTKLAKNKEEVESQRMTHITVERNRRRQMNDHLSALRSLMPTSYVQRGDQASIIGGAINFVKELEQLLQSLQAQKRIKGHGGGGGGGATSSSAAVSFDGMFESSPQPKIKQDAANCAAAEGGRSDEFTAEKKSAAAHVQARVIQNHANLKIECRRRAGQLLKAIVALEELRLTVLHLNITSSETSVQYSFNLKIEDDCTVRSVDEITGAVHQIFNYINCSSC